MESHATLAIRSGVPSTLARRHGEDSRLESPKLLHGKKLCMIEILRSHPRLPPGRVPIPERTSGFSLCLENAVRCRRHTIYFVNTNPRRETRILPGRVT